MNESEISMAALPLPPPLPRRDRRGGNGAVAVGFGKNRRGSFFFQRSRRGSGRFSTAMDISGTNIVVF
jgi:hypothetical protein